MEIKNFFYKSFVGALNSVSVVYSSGWQNCRPIFSSLGMTMSKILIWMSFFWQNWFDISFWFMQGMLFRFSSISHDLETTKLLSKCPCKRNEVLFMLSVAGKFWLHGLLNYWSLLDCLIGVSKGSGSIDWFLLATWNCLASDQYKLQFIS